MIFVLELVPAPPPCRTKRHHHQQSQDQRELFPTPVAAAFKLTGERGTVESTAAVHTPAYPLGRLRCR